MFKARRADFLQVWDALRASQNGYSINSIVSRRAGGLLTKNLLAYRKKSSALSVVPPEESGSDWVVDKAFAAPWDSNVTYEIGDVVFFDNGQKSYLYLASPRYFGGNIQPNREEDGDGVRTWEIQMNYKFRSNGSMPEILIPCRKSKGFINGKAHGKDIHWPEDSINYAYWFINHVLTPPYTGQKPLYNSVGWPYSINYEVKVGELVKSKSFGVDFDVEQEHTLINSVYQSNPYDSSTYSFEIEVGEGENKRSIHRRRGHHKAAVWGEDIINEKFVKPTQQMKKQAALATSQFAYVDSSGFDQIDENKIYWRKHGFSIEMWPSAMPNEFSLVPTTGLRDAGNNYQFKYLQRNPIPSYDVGVLRYPDSLGYYSPSQFRGAYRIESNPVLVSVNEETWHVEWFYPPPTDYEQDPNLESSLSTNGTAFLTNSPYFQDLNATILIKGIHYPIDDYMQVYYSFLATVITGYKDFGYGPVPQTKQQEFYGYGWADKPFSPTRFKYQTLTKSTNSRESSFMDNRNAPYFSLYGVATRQRGPTFSLSGFIKRGHDTNLIVSGWSVD